ncbi:ACT domain-containing protein [Proteiniclasticum sediminis]|uniref:ACT domain-containing protein n=1 Tax=Proteiniclasticum sediminis TaxID=2804028 RepID=UPI0038B52514
MNEELYIVNSKILPEIFTKVLEVKTLLHTGKVKDISEGVKAVGISRSAYYKYKDHVFLLSEGSKGRKATFSFLIAHEAGVLAKVLEKLRLTNANIITINQDIPINNAASVNLTIDTSAMNVSVKELLDSFEQEPYIISIQLVAVE